MNDLISRQAAIDAFELITWYHQNRDGEMVKGANSKEHQAWYKAEDVYKVINDLPSAQPRPRGQWLPDNRNYYEDRFVCSVCERSYEVDTCMGDPTWDFCPGCGADMREEEQNEQ